MNIGIIRYIASCVGEHWITQSGVVIKATKTMVTVKFSNEIIMKFNRKSGFPVGFRKDGSLPSFYIEEEDLRRIKERFS